MRYDVVRRKRALWDVIEIAEYLGEGDPALAERFMDAVDASIEFLRDFPESGTKLEVSRKSMDNARLWPVKGFPNHLIIFKPHGGTIDILRICHGARDLEQLS